MAKLVRLPDELYDYIQNMSHDGESMGVTIKRLMDVEQSKGRIERQYSHREELIPRVVYNFSILEGLVNANGKWTALRGEPEAKTSSALMEEFRANRYITLRERYPAEKTRNILNKMKTQAYMRKEEYLEEMRIRLRISENLS